MALIDGVKAACKRLAAKGWGPYLQRHGLDITAADLAAELTRALPGIDRNVPGFEDFAAEGVRGIEVGSPARSLLYHALASPNVQDASLKEFPTLEEIEAVENYVFGIEPPSIQELASLADGNLLALVIFATEYRPAVDTPLRKHADLCFSRTGVARVGTDEPLYDAAARGFVPLVAKDDFAIRVLPARYSVWIAAQRKGNRATFGPMRFQPGDLQRDFWVPLHKLFSGRECIVGFDLTVGLNAHHVNEKIRRIHLELTRRGSNTGWNRPDIDNPPFRFTEGIAAFSSTASDGSGLLVPVPHKPLVEEAKYKGKTLTFRVPPSNEDFSPSLEITSSGPRPAPEYVHVRHAPKLATPNLNDLPDVAGAMEQGKYDATHYIDFTGDGWIDPVCPQLASEFPRTVPAYSIVAAPDFYFAVDQRELMEWWETRAPAALREFLWGRQPGTLSDDRMPPNLKLNNVDFQSSNTSLPIPDFRPQDQTPTAIVSIAARLNAQQRPLRNTARGRHTPLPDGASGEFAPGWDTSVDTTKSVQHLAAYGLGSPFPEDSKLCAALSTFWPSVSPDSGRSTSAIFATVSPMTDEEIGSTGKLPWDGVPGPKLVKAGNQTVVEYPSFEHIDYVESALNNRFTIKLTSAIDTRQYTARVVAMARAYRAVGVSSVQQKRTWQVLSFMPVDAKHADVAAAKKAPKTKNIALGGDVFRFELFKPVPLPAAQQPKNHRLRRIGMTRRTTILVGGNREVLFNDGNGWNFIDVPT